MADDELHEAVEELRALATKVAGWGSQVLLDECAHRPTTSPVVRRLAGDVLRLFALARCEVVLAALHPAPSPDAYHAGREPVQRVGDSRPAEGPADRLPVGA